VQSFRDASGGGSGLALACGHPLHTTVLDHSVVALRVLVLHPAGEHDAARLKPAVRVVGKASRGLVGGHLHAQHRKQPWDSG
jgi:hypothetical protein